MFEFMVGFIIGMILTMGYILAHPKKYSGTFSIDLRQDSKEPIRLDITDNLNDIYSKNDILLKVNILDDSQ